MPGGDLADGVGRRFEAGGQFHVTLAGVRVGGGPGGQFAHFLLAAQAQQLVEDAADLGPVAFYAFGDLGDLRCGMLS